MQPLSFTLEAVIDDLDKRKSESLKKGLINNIRKLCRWQPVSHTPTL